tara:strand:- start:101 stop:571 length:471 start_codon:yes stop_codon:yes gene_type:complete
MSENTVDEKKEENLRYVYIKLCNGDSLMCCTTDMIDDMSEMTHIQVIDPLQVLSLRMPYKGTIVEKYMFQSWIPFSESNVVNLAIDDILYIGDLKPQYVEQYVEYTTSMLDNEDESAFDLDFSGDDDDDDEDFDDLDEQQQSIETSQKEAKKKWLH